MILTCDVNLYLCQKKMYAVLNEFDFFNKHGWFLVKYKKKNLCVDPKMIQHDDHALTVITCAQAHNQ